MKVLNIMTNKLGYEGISQSVLNYFNNIDNQKFKIDFVAADVVEEIKMQINKKGGQVYIIKNRTKNPFTYIQKLSKLIKQNKYDIVHAHGSSSMLCLETIAAKRAGVKIRIIHSHNVKTQHNILDKLLRPVLYKTYTHGFACGKEAGKWLFRDREFTVINNGKDTQRFKYNKEVRQELRKKYNIEDKIVIGHVGNFNYQKNHEFLIDVFYKLLQHNSNYYLMLIGKGGLQESIKAKVQSLNMQDKVFFVGATSEVEKYLQAMDIMVFPSRFEGFPNVLVEWQINGLPSFISSVITKEVKLTNLVEFLDLEKGAEYWAEKISKLQLQDRENVKDTVIAQIKNEGYDIKENAKRLEHIYENLIKEVNKL